jgi:endonuclease VIII
VPEGDTIHRTATALRMALVGKYVERFDAQRLVGPRPTDGRIIERVESHGKHLEIVWDDGLILHTHMRMTGSWHLYRVGERWRKPSSQLRVAITVQDWVAVCFNAPVVETYRAFDRHRHPGFGRLGPDLCRTDADLAACVEAMAEYGDGTDAVAEVLLDQRVMCGVGNVYRSEILWACEMHPFAQIGWLDAADRRDLVRTGARLLRSNLDAPGRITTVDAPGGLAVYGRNGQRCVRCGDTVVVRRVGEYQRVLYWCPGCQTKFQQQRQAPDDRVMDPHPAAAKFLAELPWRRNDPLAG